MTQNPLLQLSNTEAERGILGAILLEHPVDPTILDRIGAIVTDKDFYDTQNQAIYRAMLGLHDAGLVVEPTLLYERLHASGALKKVGADLTVTTFHDMIHQHPMAQNATEYARIVADGAGKRRLVITAQTLLIDLGAGKYKGKSAEAIRDQYVQKLNKAVPAIIDTETRKTSWTAAELLAADLPEPIWVISGILPVGLAFLAGRPKVGKSYLALQIAIAVGTGGRVLDEVVQYDKVLYIALEDNKHRLKRRLEKSKNDKTPDIQFELEWRTVGQGGLTELQAAIQKNKYGFVIIDTLSRFAGTADQRDVGKMTSVLGELQRLAQTYNLTILVIDHHRKPKGFAEDPIDDIMESTAKGAVCDVALGLYKEQGRKGARLMLRGRDMADKDLTLEWNAQTWCWQVMGETGKVKKESLQADVLTAIEVLVKLKKLPTTTNIAEHLEKSKGSVNKALSDLVNEGHVVSGEKQGRQQPYYTLKTVPKGQQGTLPGSEK